MNAYDFDGTLLLGDSENYFIKYVFRNYKISFKNRIKFWFSFIKMRLGINELKSKEDCYAFLAELNDVDEILETFWNEHKKYLMNWHKGKIKSEDVIISNTPRFILLPVLKYTGTMNLIATEMDKHTGKITGNLCKKEEKVIRFKELYKDVIPEEFYSDSNSDTPMAMYSLKAFKVNKESVTPWK